MSNSPTQSDSSLAGVVSPSITSPTVELLKNKPHSSSSSEALELSDRKRSLDKPAKKNEEVDQVSKQTENLNTEGTIWHCIKFKLLDKALEIIQADKRKLLDERGAVGETPLHLLFLLNGPQPILKPGDETPEISPYMIFAKKLMTDYPACATQTYKHEIYEGESVLHIAIVNRDVEMVRWLIHKFPELLDIPATGKFFQGESPCYYGEYPIAFAASTNHVPILKMLLEAGAHLYQVDSSGNNLLHMCVIHNQSKMYGAITKIEKKLWDEKKEIKSKVKLSKMTNKDGFTPLTLAATMGQQAMFDYILENQRENQWSYGPVSCNIYPLEELDTLRDESEIDAPTCALEIIVRKKHLDLLNLPRVLALLNMKWDKYAGYYFYRRCALTSFYVAVFTIAVILRTPNFHYSNTSGDIGRAIAEIFCVIGWLYKGYNEMRELFSSGLRYFNQSGSAFLENNLSFIFLWSFLFAILSEAGNSDAKYFFTFMCVFTCCTYLLTLLLGFELTGPFVIMLYRMLGNDVARFGTIYLLILFGHSVCFYAIEIPTGHELFHEFFFRLETDFYVLLAQFNFQSFADATEPHYQWLTSILLLIHVIFCLIILLNILIAMVGDTYGDVKEKSAEEWRLAYAQIIFSIESELTPETLNKLDYWTKINGKRYLQVEDVDKTYFSVVTESLIDVIKDFDVNKDGVISASELREGERKLKEMGVNATIEQIESLMGGSQLVMRRQESVRTAQLDKDNIGVKDGDLENRLAKELTYGSEKRGSLMGKRESLIGKRE